MLLCVSNLLPTQKRRRSTKWVLSGLAPAKTACMLTRVSTKRQALQGYGRKAQRRKGESWAKKRGVQIVRHISTKLGESTRKELQERKDLIEAMEFMDTHQAEILLIPNIGRLVRSNQQFSELIDRAQKGGWLIVSIDPDVDMTTPTGLLMAKQMMGVFEWERDIIAERTREGLAELKAEGVQLGPKRQIPKRVIRSIVDARMRRESYRDIASQFNRGNVPTVSGKPWTFNMVYSAIRTGAGRQIAESYMNKHYGNEGNL